jgi:glutamate synthase (NADPH) large chain
MLKRQISIREDPGLKTLHQPDFERDSCGFGLVAQLDDQPEHQILVDALDALRRLTHRGAVAPDGKTGDGCGLLLKTPESYFRRLAEELGLELGERFAVGMLFLAPDEQLAGRQRELIERHLAGQGLAPAGWREVPTNPDACGRRARDNQPRIEQVFVNPASHMESAAFERALYLARRLAESEATAHGNL